MQKAHSGVSPVEVRRVRGRGQAAYAQPFPTGPVVPTCSHVLNKVTFSETLIQRGETLPDGTGVKHDLRFNRTGFLTHHLLRGVR